MKRKVIISIICIVIVLLIAIVGGGVLTKRWINEREKITTSNIDNESINQLQEDTVENNLQDEIQVAEINNNENTVDSNTNRDENAQGTNENKEDIQKTNSSTNEKEKNKNVTSNNQEKKPEIVQDQTPTEDAKKEDNQTPAEEPKKENNQNPIEDTKKDNQATTPSEDTKKEDDSHPELANKTYRVTNTEILPEIKRILEDEISKDQELVDFGTTVITTNKSNAYANTTGFTYMFVNQIEKGKVAGNYQKFEQRVRNNAGAFGKYYIYAEDEYVYNGEGKNPKWCQTLVWIYVTF